MKKLLPDSEWKFSETQIPDTESVACVYYEYGREAENFKKRVAVWREQNPEVMRVARELLFVDRSMADKAAPFMAQPPPSDAIPRNENEAAVWRLSIILRIWFTHTFSIQCTGNSELAHPDGTWNSQHAFLYRFPPFPDTPWLELDKFVRESALSFFYKPRQLNKSPDMGEVVKGQKKIQTLAKIPLDEEVLKTVVSEHGDFFVSAPALREGDFLAGILPLASRLEKENSQLWMADYCHEQANFIVNWSHSDSKINQAFAQWLKSRRPPNDARQHFEPWKGAKPIDLLKKLGALRILKHLKQKNGRIEEACGWDAKTGKLNYDLYQNPESYRKEKSQAEKVLATMFPLLNE